MLSAITLNSTWRAKTYKVYKHKLKSLHLENACRKVFLYFLWVITSANILRIFKKVVFLLLSFIIIEFFIIEFCKFFWSKNMIYFFIYLEFFSFQCLVHLMSNLSLWHCQLHFSCQNYFNFWLLLRYKNPIEFCILILLPAIFIDLLFNSSSFCVGSIVYST